MDHVTQSCSCHNDDAPILQSDCSTDLPLAALAPRGSHSFCACTHTWHQCYHVANGMLVILQQAFFNMISHAFQTLLKSDSVADLSKV